MQIFSGPWLFFAIQVASTAYLVVAGVSLGTTIAIRLVDSAAAAVSDGAYRHLW
jgi:hypothetical protein